jgi:hypothetical protein
MLITLIWSLCKTFVSWYVWGRWVKSVHRRMEALVCEERALPTVCFQLVFKSRWSMTVKEAFLNLSELVS